MHLRTFLRPDAPDTSPDVPSSAVPSQDRARDHQGSAPPNDRIDSLSINDSTAIDDKQSPGHDIVAIARWGGPPTFAAPSHDAGGGPPYCSIPQTGREHALVPVAAALTLEQVRDYGCVFFAWGVGDGWVLCVYGGCCWCWSGGLGWVGWCGVVSPLWSPSLQC